MLKSMTGFGKAEKTTELYTIKVEIKSVNSKYCDINLRLPRSLSVMEIPVRNMIQERMLRGKIEAHIDVHFTKPISTPKLNEQNFNAALYILKDMKKRADITSEINLDNLLKFNDIIEYETTSTDDHMEAFLEVISKCLTAIDDMRTQEGVNLQKLITHMLSQISSLVSQVTLLTADLRGHWMEKFRQRVADMDITVSEERIIQEAAIYAEKADVAEELGRINSHLMLFEKIIQENNGNGKKLDFLCQELYREWNTIASKSTKADIINQVVEAKSMVDKIREQIQNIV